MIFYFSGCGNSLHAAEMLAEHLHDTMVFIPEATRNHQYRYTLGGDEPLGFVFPIYSWAPPRLVLDFVKQLQLTTKPEYVYFVCTCGDQCGHTEKIFRKAIEEKGWKLSACFSLIMPETYIGMPGFKLDTEENAKKKIEAALYRNSNGLHSSGSLYCSRFWQNEFCNSLLCCSGTFYCFKRKYPAAGKRSL